jgi:hypothetical protein
MTKSQPGLTTTSSDVPASTPKLTPFSGQGDEVWVLTSQSTTSPASSAGTSSSLPESSVSFIATALEELGEVLKRKNSDYKVTSSEFSNFHYAADVAGIPTRDAILTQIGIKLGRLKGLTQRNADPNWESIEDTAKDLAGYAVILYAYYLEMMS